MRVQPAQFPPQLGKNELRFLICLPSFLHGRDNTVCFDRKCDLGVAGDDQERKAGDRGTSDRVKLQENHCTVWPTM